MCVLLKRPRTGANFLRLALVCPPRLQIQSGCQYPDVSILASSLLFPWYTSCLVSASGIDVRAVVVFVGLDKERWGQSNRA